MHPNTASHGRREAIVILAISAFVVGGALLCLSVLAGGFVLAALAAFALVAALACLHYLAWGRTLGAGPDRDVLRQVWARREALYPPEEEQAGQSRRSPSANGRGHP